jgi:hypothetical protein
MTPAGPTIAALMYGARIGDELNRQRGEDGDILEIWS